MFASRSVLGRIGHLIKNLIHGPPHPVARRRGGQGRRGGPGGGMPLTQLETQGFIYDNHILWVGSSCVASAQYFIYAEKLLVEYRSGGVYLYSQITEDDAFWFARNKSKGSFVWDKLRTRGKGGNKIPKKSFIQIR